MKDYLTDCVRMAVVGDDVVVLDVAKDAYACLIGAAAFIQLGREGQIESGPARLALNEAGFLKPEPGTAWRECPPTPSIPGSTSLQCRPTVQERTRFARTALTMFRRYERTGFSDLIVQTKIASPISATGSTDRAIRYAALFALWLPWVPAQGACLYRAFMLRQFLNSAGLRADWVFGVATWPFSAHCWLQIGDVLLDDDIDRVRGYTPIMVV